MSNPAIARPDHTVGSGCTGPAAYAAALVRWAGDEPAKIAGAILAGNGKTMNATLRRLTVAQMEAALPLLLAQPPLPFSSTPHGVYEVRREMSKR